MDNLTVLAVSVRRVKRLSAETGSFPLYLQPLAGSLSVTGFPEAHGPYCADTVESPYRSRFIFRSQHVAAAEIILESEERSRLLMTQEKVRQ